MEARLTGKGDLAMQMGGLLSGIVKLTDCRDTKQPYPVFIHSFNTIQYQYIESVSARNA